MLDKVKSSYFILGGS